MGQAGSGGNRGSGGTGGTGGKPLPRKPTGSTNRPAGSSGSRGASGQTRRAASQTQGRSTGGRPSGSSRPPVRRESATPPPSGFRATIDRTLPPFSIRRYMVIWVLMMLPLALVLFLLLRPGGDNSGTSGSNGTTGGNIPALTSAGSCQAPNEPGKYFLLDTAKGCIAMKLYTDSSANVANTIANFEQKANMGYFNGLTFHRVEDWVIQGGDPQGTGGGGGKMPSEYNNLPFKPGSLGIARGQDPSQNNDSQFFITKGPSDHLNGIYTNWGEVVQGMDVVNNIAIGDVINTAAVVEKK